MLIFQNLHVSIVSPIFQKFTVQRGEVEFLNWIEFQVVLNFPPPWKLMQGRLLFHRRATPCKFPFILQEWFPCCIPVSDREMRKCISCTSGTSTSRRFSLTHLRKQIRVVSAGLSDVTLPEYPHSMFPPSLFVLAQYCVRYCCLHTRSSLPGGESLLRGQATTVNFGSFAAVTWGGDDIRAGKSIATDSARST